MYPQRNLWESFSRESFASLPYIKGLTEPLTRVLKKHGHSCKQTIYHSRTTVPSSEIPTFDVIADLRCVENALYKLLVVLYWPEQGELSIPEKHQNCGQVLELLITPNPATTPLILKTRQLLA